LRHRQKGKFWVRAKFAFLLKEQIKNCQRAETVIALYLHATTQAPQSTHLSE
jgi:hypothetical protein